MQDVAFALQHQVHDERSRERSYTLRVENRGTERLHVQGIVPRIPKKVDLVEAQDMASIGAQKRQAHTCITRLEYIVVHLQ